MDETMIVPRTVILVDPSSPDGEGGLGVLTPEDRAVTLLLTLEGRSAAALREFADAENIDVSIAGLIYLDQVACRMRVPTDDIETVSAAGPDPVDVIFHMLQDRPVHRVIVPASLPGLEAGGLAKLLRACPVPVIVAPRAEVGDDGFPIAS
jgi:hypothetical protein